MRAAAPSARAVLLHIIIGADLGEDPLELDLDEPLLLRLTFRSRFDLDFGGAAPVS